MKTRIVVAGETSLSIDVPPARALAEAPGSGDDATSYEIAHEALIRGWERGQFCIHFPKCFTRVVRFLSMLPDWLYFRIIHRATGL